jgi:hypothetical protein
MPERLDTELLEILVAQQGQGLGIDGIGLEAFDVLLQTHLAKPARNVHTASPSNGSH